jgi:hypothetical protein
VLRCLVRRWSGADLLTAQNVARADGRRHHQKLSPSRDRREGETAMLVSAFQAVEEAGAADGMPALGRAHQSRSFIMRPV